MSEYSRRTRGAVSRRLSVQSRRATLGIAASLAVASLQPSQARASCNLIPVAASSFRSTKGGVVSPITAPGEIVQLELNSCDGSTGFENTPADNEVTITFEPPAGSTTTVVVNTDFGDAFIQSTSNCTLPGGRCRTLRFEMPDTTGFVLPDMMVATDGLAGPASITVRDKNDVVVAQIGSLNLPALSCDMQPETIFERFTVLPRANNFFDLDNGTATQILATVDGGNNLLIPFDYWGNGTRSVLVQRPGAPSARFLEGDALIDAFNGGPPTVSQVVAAQPSPDKFVRSFTFTGRPLPPLLRVKTGGGLYGAADASASVLRVADSNGGPAIFDVSDRLSREGRGPIIIGSPAVDVRSPMPLKSLRSSADTVAYARDEFRESANINPDGDQFDFVPQIVDAETAAVFNTQEAATQITSGSFVTPAMTAAGEIVSYLRSENGQGFGDQNFDGDTYDNFLRAFLRDGTNLSPVVLEDVSAARLVNGQPIAISNDKVFFRGPSPVTQAAHLGNLIFDVALSPDGKNVYVTSRNTSSLIVLTRNLATGQVSFLEEEINGLGGVSGLTGPHSVAVAPDGLDVYVTVTNDNSLVRFARNPVDGSLTWIGAVGFGFTILDDPQKLAISSDSQFIYVVCALNNAVCVYQRGGVDGVMFVEAEVEGANGVIGLYGPRGIAVSPDDQHVYVSTISSVVAFARSGFTGELTFLEAHRDGFEVPASTIGNGLLAIPPDGKHVYMASQDWNAISVFARNAGTGQLAYIENITDAADTFPLLNAPFVLAISPDGHHVHATASSILTTFQRNSETGHITIKDAFFSGSSGFDGGFLPVGLTVSQDVSQDIYVGGLDGVGTALYLLRPRQQTLAVLDTSTQSILTTRPPASVVSVAGERAIFLKPEIGADEVHMYDATVPVTGLDVNLNIAGSRVAISDSLAAYTAVEADENVSFNAPSGDGDLRDEILFVVEQPGFISVNAGAGAEAMSVTGNTVVLITREAEEPPGGPNCAPTIPPGGCDLNGDFDANDRVIRLYEYNPMTNTGDFVEIGQAAEDFEVDGQLVAFRTAEQSANEYLNDDGDQADAVMQVYDLATHTLFNTHRSAALCTLPGCDANLPYKVLDLGTTRTVAFLTDERDEAPYPLGDLDLDGDADDIVLTIYNVRTGLGDTVDVVMDDATGLPPPPETSPFPDKPFQGALLTNEVLESSIGVDVDEDGDLGDRVVLVVGDADADGTVDDLDVCREVDQDDQEDFDGDALGDADCDPAPAPPCPPTPRMTCLSPGKSSVQLKNDDDAAKDSLKFKWGNGEETLVSDFGDPDTTGTSNYTLCLYDSSAAPQPLSSAVAFAGARLCGKKPCWQDLGDKGFKFKDKEGFFTGVVALGLKPGTADKAAVQARGKGVNLALPALPLTAPVTVQLVVNPGLGEKCWSSTFTAAKKEGPDLWQASLP